MAQYRDRRRLALTPECLPLEERQVLSPGASTGLYPDALWLAQQPAFRADAESMHDLQTLRVELRAVVKETRRDFPAIVRLLRDNTLVIKAMSAPGDDLQRSAEIQSSPRFLTLDPRDQAGENAYHALLLGSNVPEPLLDRLFADRQVLLGRFKEMLPEGTAMVATVQRLLADGLRTGTIKPGDSIFNEMTTQIAESKNSPLFAIHASP